MISFLIAMGVGVLLGGYFAGKGDGVAKQATPLPLPTAKVPSPNEAVNQLYGVADRINQMGRSSPDTDAAIGTLIESLRGGK